MEGYSGPKRRSSGRRLTREAPEGSRGIVRQTSPRELGIASPYPIRRPRVSRWDSNPRPSAPFQVPTGASRQPASASDAHVVTTVVTTGRFSVAVLERDPLYVHQGVRGSTLTPLKVLGFRIAELGMGGHGSSSTESSPLEPMCCGHQAHAKQVRGDSLVHYALGRNAPFVLLANDAISNRAPPGKPGGFLRISRRSSGER